MDLFNFEIETTPSTKKFSKTIGVAKFGRSIKFGINLDQKTNSMGDWEVTNFLSIRSKYEPDTKFLYLSSSNFFKLSEEEKNIMFPNKNVFSINYRDFSYIDYNDPSEIRNRSILTNHEETKDVSEVWVFAGPNSRTCGCIDGLMNNKGTEYKPLLMFKRYCGALYTFLNKTNVKWYHIVTDNRYFIQSYDLLTTPALTYAQASKNFQYSYKGIESEQNKILIERKASVVASDVLALWLYGKKHCNPVEKQLGVIAVANQIKEKGDPRVNLLKKYVTDTKIGTILGSWEGDDNYSLIKSSLYNREGLSKDDMEAELKKYRFGLIFKYDSLKIASNSNKSIADIYWLVSKIYEYVYYGVIPIFIEYPISSNYYNLPEELFVKSPKELSSLLEKFKNIDTKAYARKLYENLITSDKLDGTYFYSKGEFSL